MPTQTNNPFSALLNSRKSWVGVIAVIAIAVSYAFLPNEKADKIAMAVTALSMTLMGSIAYEDGKSNEGTVPEGRVPVAPTQINVAPAAATTTPVAQQVITNTDIPPPITVTPTPVSPPKPVFVNPTGQSYTTTDVSKVYPVQVKTNEK